MDSKVILYHNKYFAVEALEHMQNMLPKIIKDLLMVCGFHWIF
jgi:hypothetical protein